MLKPDSTRYPSVVKTHISGPEWMEADAVESEADPGETAAFRGREDLPTGVALDMRLREILQQARLATAASGAVIALARGGKMVCRATLGEKAPSAGVCLNTRSGLSGACVQTREMQLCDDTLADPRVNAVACRDLGIRSIVVLPVLDGGELWGVLEVFSSVPRAFSDSDLQALQSLNRKIAHSVHEALEGGLAALELETFFQPPRADRAQTPTAPAETAQSPPAQAPLSQQPRIAESITAPEPDRPDDATVRRDYRTGILTAAVLVLALMLGWMVGRVGWTMAVNRAPAPVPMSQEEAQAREQAAPQTHPAPPPSQETPAAATPSVAKPVTGRASLPASSHPAPKIKTETQEPPNGGLVVYEHGKVVFRMAPAQKESASSESGVAGSNVIQKAATREDDGLEVPAAGGHTPTPGYLVEQVEPVYPEAARQQRIQGPVVLNALVGTDGSVLDLKVISGDALLTKAATDAVRQWRFRPRQFKGKAAEFETRITVNFTLP